MTLRDFCVALLAGSMGVGGTVAVQKARPVVQKKAPAKPSKVVKTTPAAPRAPAVATPSPMLDCPMPSAGDVPMVDLPTLGMSTGPTTYSNGVWVHDGGGGVWGGPGAAVPEPTGWAMLVAGFGFVGLSLRRRRK